MRIAQAPAPAGMATLLATRETWEVLATAITTTRAHATAEWGKAARAAIEAALRTAPEGGAVRVTMDADAAIAVLRLAETV